MSTFLTYHVKISPVIHALALESYSVGSDFTFLKQRGLAALLKTNSGTLSYLRKQARFLSFFLLNVSRHDSIQS